MKESVVAAMHVVHGNLGGLVQGKSVAKPDGTIVTATDLASEQAALAVLQRELPGTELLAEEGGKIGRFNRASAKISGQDICILVDALDGSKPFANGGSPTVIEAVYDTQQQLVIGCMIGEPATGRIWSAFEGEDGAFLENISGFSYLKPKTPITVWNGSFSPGATVYLDLYPNFKRKGALTNTEQSRLFASLFEQGIYISMLGTNGLHQALVANGAEGVIGSITVTKGGDWDLAGGYLVQKAGGAAMGISVYDTHGHLRSEYAPCVNRCDFLVTGTNRETADRLSHMLFALRS